MGNDFYTILNFHQNIDKRGCLIALEKLPFEIKRVYYLYNSDNSFIRGKHAHKNLEQIIISLKGSCKVSLDNGIIRDEIFLDSPNRGIFVKKPLWRELSDFSSDSVVLCLASQVFDENDYIRNYQDFLDYVL